MERVLSPDEKIRRAEEIYFRRTQRNNNVSRVAKVNVDNKKKNTYVRKLCIQFVACLLIYTGFYSIKNSEEILPKTIVDKIHEVLQYDINIEALQGKLNNYIVELNGKIDGENKENVITNQAENVTQPEEITPLPEETLGVTENQEEGTNENVITPVTEEEPKTQEESSSVSQMQLDADFIKANYSFIKPLEGQITSRFGPRENVEPKYHTGIDIAEDPGLDIVAAMEGTVEYVSGEGNYGNHLKITNGEVSTLYAHCKTICVKQGDYITQGQKIAEVGATGNATGPHLHFEILRNGELVNPDLVLQF